MSEVDRQERLGEAAYAAMYDATLSYMVKLHYENACGQFRRGIAAAHCAGALDDAERLEKRLAEIREVYNHQFRGV